MLNATAKSTDKCSCYVIAKAMNNVTGISLVHQVVSKVVLVIIEICKLIS